MSFSATDAAFEGFRLARRRPSTMLWWALAYIVMLGVPMALAAPAIASLMAATEALQSSRQPSMEDIRALSSSYLSIAGWFLVPAVVIGTMLNAAVVRSVLEPGRSAFGYLRLGMDEVRVFVVSLIIGIVTMIAMTVLCTLAGIVVGFAANGYPLLWLAVVAIVLGIIAIFALLAVRLSLAIPITVAERRIAPFASWGLTKGRFWPLLGLALLAFVLSMVVSLLSGIVSMPITMVTGGGLAQLGDLEGEPLQAILAAAWPGLLAWCVVNAIFSALQLAVLYAPFSAAYAQIKGVAPAED